MKKSTIILLVIAIVLIVGGAIFLAYTNNKDAEGKGKTIQGNDGEAEFGDEEAITEDYNIVSFMRINKKAKYECCKDGENFNNTIELSADEFDLPLNLCDYSDEVKLRITISPVDNSILDCKVVNRSNNKIIEDISEENIEKLFNIEYGKTINEMEYVEEVHLSELEENEIYKFANGGEEKLPIIVNDTGKNCIVYNKNGEDFSYDKKIYTGRTINGDSISFSYNDGEALYVMYKKADNGELLKMIEPDDIIYIDDNVKNGDELSYSFENYIYNNTDNKIKLITKSDFMDEENEKEFEMESSEICEFDWMIDSVVVEY